MAASLPDRSDPPDWSADKRPGIEQAIFTSLRGGPRDGYQLAKTSPGLQADDARELSAWGPAHDSLRPSLGRSTSVSFHRLASGNFCLGRSRLDVAEYSGRGGRRVFTHWLVVPPLVMARFRCHPLRLLDAATSTWGFTADLAAELPSLSLVGTAAPFQASRLAPRLFTPLFPQLLHVLDALLDGHRLALDARRPPRDLADALFDLVPPSWRSELSFCTGLRQSARRPFRLMFFDHLEPAERRALERAGYRVLQPDSRKQPAEPVQRWTRLLERQARQGGMRRVGRLLRRAARISHGPPVGTAS